MTAEETSYETFNIYFVCISFAKIMPRGFNYKTNIFLIHGDVNDNGRVF